MEQPKKNRWCYPKLNQRDSDVKDAGAYKTISTSIRRWPPSTEVIAESSNTVAT